MYLLRRVFFHLIYFCSLSIILLISCQRLTRINVGNATIAISPISTLLNALIRDSAKNIYKTMFSSVLIEVTPNFSVFRMVAKHKFVSMMMHTIIFSLGPFRIELCKLSIPQLKRIYQYKNLNK